MLDLFRHSDAAEVDEIITRYAAIGTDTGKDSASREREFRDLLQALPAAIYTTDAQGRITFFNRACIDFAGRTPKIGEMWCVTWKLFLPDGTPLPHAECPMAIALKENRPVRDVEAVAERPDGSRICFMPYPTPLRDERGRLIGAVNMLVDITNRKQVEERMMLLTYEVDHRSNNLLAVIQAMLRLTKAETAVEFQAAFQGRLSALANVQRLFTVSRWTGASLKTIVAEELRPYASDDEGRVDIAGDDVHLPSALAQAIAVAVHELATNAAKYGSLSAPSGKIEIRWKKDGADHLLLSWSETDGPRIQEPTRKGFGVGAIDGVLRTLGGKITRQWRPEGLLCELSFPVIGTRRASSPIKRQI
jgi:PAS domain S-box-containing protein